MNRTTALTVEAPLDFIPTGYVYEESVNNCIQLGMKVIWFESYDMALISSLANFNIIANLKLWYDNGSEEVMVNEDTYNNHNVTDLYLNRSGKYDPIDEQI